jgi:N-acetylneuraminate synthase
MKIENRTIGLDASPYIVFDIGAGHNGTLESVRKLIFAAADAGADAAKLQVYKPEDLTIKTSHPDFTLKAGPWAGETLYDLYARAALQEEWLPELFEYARKVNITLFASIFSPRVLPLLESLACPAYKIASAEIGYHKLLYLASATGKPVILSAGMASIEDLDQAWTRVDEPKAILHCVSEYPCIVERANLSRIKELQCRYHPELTGLSDHTPGSLAAVAAVGMGATIIEKHLAMAGSPDAVFGIRPYEAADFVSAVRMAWKAINKEEGVYVEARGTSLKRSIRALRDIELGEALTEENIGIVRPGGDGVSPGEIWQVLGKAAARPFAQGELVL